MGIEIRMMLEMDNEVVLEAVEKRRLPLRQPDRQWGGNGAGTHCSICGQLIQTDALEYELEFDGDDPAAGRHHVHVPCFTAWERLVLSQPLPMVARAPKNVFRPEPLRLSAGDGKDNISSGEYAASTESRLDCASARDARGIALPGRQRGPSSGGGMG